MNVSRWKPTYDEACVRDENLTYGEGQTGGYHLDGGAIRRLRDVVSFLE